MNKSLLECALECQVIEFGDFTLKSGRHSPYFFNAARLLNGNMLWALANAYADKICQEFPTATTIFGPAYKGIPLASATAIALAQRGINVEILFDRKEAKTHGEGGTLIGNPKGKIVILDDVITRGTALGQALEKLPEGCEVLGLITAFDRQEAVDVPGIMASAALAEKYGIKILSLLCFSDLMQKLNLATDVQTKLTKYREEYGV